MIHPNHLQPMIGTQPPNEALIEEHLLRKISTASNAEGCYLSITETLGTKKSDAVSKGLRSSIGLYCESE
jgi:hypothetical protein